MMTYHENQEREAFEPLRLKAEQLLSAALDNKIHINKVECLTEKGRRNLLLRCFINPVGDLPSSFII
ncbi:hypothetical protein [Pleurocapsa sp. FMAR1]|uniref:hypothetical protein n=1 Tax=Pleurocapsa sp. FMAR1 TaxID=3040204 RepID=UPI0029C95530|nr:hypothetical protein [Pleurocapsa sp. FMAR1]